MEENIPTVNQPEVQEIKKGNSLFLPKKTIILIVALLLVAVGLVYLATYNYEKPKEEKAVIQQDEKALIQTSLALSNPIFDTASTASAKPVYSIDVNADTGENMLTVVQLELQYDPLAITDVDIGPGDLNGNWASIKKEIDQENGTIYCILGVPMGGKGISGPGSVAKLTFSKVDGFEFSESAIRFLSRTKTIAQGYDKSVLKSSEDLIFTFPSEEMTSGEELILPPEETQLPIE